MKVAYLQRRERFSETLLQTLSAGWSEQYGSDVRLTPPAASTGGRPWFFHPRFSVYYGMRPGEHVREFLRARFRHNSRRPHTGQALLSSALSTPPALRLLARKAFHVRGPQHSDAHLLVLPGNNRVRVFDFEAQVCRVLLKRGFPNDTMRREVEVRSRRTGPFPRIDAWSVRFDWFEERILDAVPISRCPSPSIRMRAEQTAFEALDSWLAGTCRDVAADSHVDALLQKIRRDVVVLAARLGDQLVGVICGATDQLARHAVELGEIRLAEVHGDLILSNILVSTNSEDIYLVDWERSEERVYWYDHFVYGLRSRYVPGLAGRIEAFIDRRVDGPVLHRLPNSRRWRSAASALFLLEDLSFQLHANAAAPYIRITDELRRFLSELEVAQAHLRPTVSG